MRMATRRRGRSPALAAGLVAAAASLANLRSCGPRASLARGCSSPWFAAVAASLQAGARARVGAAAARGCAPAGACERLCVDTFAADDGVEIQLAEGGAEHTLLYLLALEVARDGGVSDAARLCGSGDRGDGADFLIEVRRLLRICGCSKLLPFVRRHPNVIVVETRGSAHYLRLLVPPSSASGNGVASFSFFAAEVAAEVAAETPDASDVEVHAERLARRSELALRQRAVNKRRRGRASYLPPVALQWLLLRVSAEVHGLLRLLPAYRPQGCEPFSECWHAAALPFLVQFLEERPDRFCIELGVSSAPCASENVTGNFIVGPQVQLRDLDWESVSSFEVQELDDLQGRILEFLRSAGLHFPGSAGIPLGCVARDAEVHSLLQGRSLLEALAIEPLAGSLERYRDPECGGDWRVRIRGTAGLQVDGEGQLVTEGFQADAEGLYSVTGRRAAKAMARMLARCFEEHLGLPALAAGSRCVDMTAGVGGNTAALARAFHAVQAYEIDPTRYSLLRENLQMCGLAGRVDCILGDSVAALQAGDKHAHADAAVSSEPLPAVMLDPPWGGVNYKRKGPVELLLGGLRISQLLPILRGRASVVGLKAPVAWDAAAFLSGLPACVAGHSWRVVGRQRFLCLRLRAMRSSRRFGAPRSTPCAALRATRAKCSGGALLELTKYDTEFAPK